MLAVDVCHCDNKRWINTIEFVVHLVEELQEKIQDFRFSLVLFNDIQETVMTLDEWKPEWTLAEVYQVLWHYNDCIPKCVTFGVCEFFHGSNQK